ncbi:MAG: cytochrome c peroxidase [Bacteroidales bacterium]
MGLRFYIGLIYSALLLISFSCQKSQEPTPWEMPKLEFFPPMPVSDNTPTTEGVALGRYLFYDPVLSKDSTFSCASCHRQEVAFTDSPNQFSLGASGASMTRNTLPLFNLNWYPAYFWDGRAASLTQQVFHPVSHPNEMNLNWKEAEKRINRSAFYPAKFKAAFGNVPIDSVLIAKAIAQFEQTLLSHDSKYDKVLRGEAFFTPEEYDGFMLVNDQSKADCLHCHSTDANALGTIAQFSNNGLDPVLDISNYPDQGKGAVSGKSADFGKFKVPSLRNVAVTAPYMHDGRFKTLHEVLDFYSQGVNECVNLDPRMQNAHQGGVHLSEVQKEHILAFLSALTDSTFLSNPEFGNPFLQ